MLPRDVPLWVIPSSLLLAFLLALAPLPSLLVPWRPEWLLMLLVFWSLHQPSVVGIWTAFVLGLALDLALHTRLGVHAASLVTAVWLAHTVSWRLKRRRIGNTLWVMAALAGLFLLMRYGLLSLTGHRPLNADYWLPWFGTVLGWPLVAAVLQRWGKD